MKKSTPTLFFGGVDLPADMARQHIAILGTTGSGKTLTLRMLLKNALPEIGQGLDCRAVIYDPKRTFAPILAGMGLKDRLIFMNPFDARCTPWDVAQDIRSTADIQQFVATLIPDRNHGSNEYFYDMARLVVGGVLRSLIERLGDRWTFRHFLLLARQPADMMRTLQLASQTAHLVDQFSQTRSLPEVLSTVSSKLGHFEPVAAAWATAKNVGISLDRWVTQESILLLGEQRRHATTLKLLYQLLMNRISAALLDDPRLHTRAPTRKTWFVFDELASGPKIEDLPQLMLMGREYGVCCILGFQCSSALRALYGNDGAKTIMAQCNNRIVLGLVDHESAAEAAQDFGSVNQQGRHAQLLEPTKLQNLPPCDRIEGLHAFYKSALRISFQSHLTPQEIRRALPKRDRETKGWLPRKKRDFELQPWTPEERKRFGLLPSQPFRPLDSVEPKRSSIWDLPN